MENINKLEDVFIVRVKGKVAKMFTLSPLKPIINLLMEWDGTDSLPIPHTVIAFKTGAKTKKQYDEAYNKLKNIFKTSKDVEFIDINYVEEFLYSSNPKEMPVFKNTINKDDRSNPLTK